jgi:hypothetical protein
MSKFFWNKASGAKTDIARHRAMETKLNAKIAELEGKDDEMSVAALRIYRRLLAQLAQSKADAVSSIGKPSRRK